MLLLKGLGMNKFETVLLVAMGAISFVVTQYLWADTWDWWFIFVMIVFALNILFNGLNHRNKSYFLINFIIFVVVFPIALYYSLPNLRYIPLIFVLLMIIVWFYEYKRKENDPKKPWKNEW